MKILNKITIFIFLILPILSCSSLKQGLTNQKKGTDPDAFLVKKKSPLVIPPSYGELPQPELSQKSENEKIDLKKIITGKKKERKKLKESSIEKRILQEIKKN